MRAPLQYVKKYRFNIALTLQKHKSTLRETVQKIGYADEESFSQTFKKIYGVSPFGLAQQSNEPRENRDKPGI